MNKKEIFDDISMNINNLLITKGIDSFEFGTTSQTNQLTITPKSPKIIIWCSMNPRDVEDIRKNICSNFNLTHKENHTALYLYIRLKDWD